MNKYKTRRLGTYCLSFLMAGCLQANAQRVSFNAGTVSLKEAFQKIEASSKYKIAYNVTKLDVNKNVELNQKNTEVLDVLGQILSGTGYSYSLKGNYIVITSPESQLVSQQTKKVSGTVVDAKGEPVIGANIVVKGTTNGTITDMDGNFVLDVPEGSILHVSYIGYTDKEIPVGNQNTLSITLTEDSKALDEVVVVGYGVQKKSDVTGSVASIKPETFNDFNLDVTNVIQGRVAGVNVSNGSIIIRGAASINGSDPLWIVDGVPGSAPNFNDIESIEILKDAASTAIYGAKGAGGVILVTTKKGKAGKITINAKANLGAITPIDIPKLLSTPDFIDRKLAAGFSAPSNGAWDNPSALPNVDWNDILWKKAALQQNYFLQVTGGSEQITFNTSAEFYKNEGLAIDKEEQGGSFRIASETKLSSRVKLSEVLHVGYTSENPNYTNINYRSVPTMEPYDPTNSGGGWGQQPSGGYFNGPNPLVEELVYHDNNKTYWGKANVMLDWEIIKDLKFQANLSANSKTVANSSFRDAWKVGSLSYKDQYTKNYNAGHDLRMFYTLTYDHTFAEKHWVRGMVGYEASQSEYTGAGGWKQGFAVQPAESMSLGSTVGDVYGSTSRSRSISYFARANYSYDSKYVLEASVRRDGYDNFGKSNRFGVFPSVSAAWNMHKESFLSDYSWLSQLKLRASWGKIGNNTVPQFLYESAFVNDRLYYSYDDQNVVRGYWYKGIANPAIKWEDVAQWDLGVDASFLNNKLNITAEYYHKNTSDMLYSLSAPLSSGASSTTYYSNIGEISNKGFEFMVQYRDQISDFRYDVALTLSTNKNKVERLSDQVNPMIWQSYTWRGLNAGTHLTQNGHPMGEMYGYVVEGIFQDQSEVDALNAKSPSGLYQFAGTSAGDLKYKDLNGDGKIDAENDKTVIGDPWPKLIYGLNINLSYKNFDLSMGWVGNAGVDIFNAAKTEERTFYGDCNSTYKIYEAWSPENKNATNPRVTKDDPNGNFKNISSYFVEDGSFLKLKSLHFGYNLPKTALSVLHIQGLKVFVNCNNVFTITKFQGDPELGGGYLQRNLYIGNRYPSSRSFMGGISLTL